MLNIMHNDQGDAMKGLIHFIRDIHNCKSNEEEYKRIKIELANIQSQFKGGKILNGYQKKKYLCKLVYIFLLGYKIDSGHMVAVNLLSSNSYSEKMIAYLYISVIMNPDNELMELTLHQIKNDLTSKNRTHRNLALQCIANIGSRKMAETFGSQIPEFIVSCYTNEDTQVQQSASLCLLRLIQTQPEIIPNTNWTERIISLLNNYNLGIVTTACSLIEALAKQNPQEYQGCVPLTVSRLSRVFAATYIDLQDYSYYWVQAPWLCVKFLRLLQCYALPEEPAVKGRLLDCLEIILSKAHEPLPPECLADSRKFSYIHYYNAQNAIVFEAINLVIHYENEQNLLVKATNQLEQFLQYGNTNQRYLALQSMHLLAASEFSRETINKHLEALIIALETETDLSIRQQVVDLLYIICDKSNAEQIVNKMLHYLETGDYSVKEELVLKISLLCENYTTNYSWYVNVILRVMQIAGDYVSEKVLYRVIQIIINTKDVQQHATWIVFQALQSPTCHENLVKIGGYVLGELGNLIASDKMASPIIQFNLLHSKFPFCSGPTKALLLSTYVKFINLFPEIKPNIQAELRRDIITQSPDPELQQRAIEYLMLTSATSTSVSAAVLQPMPPFPEGMPSTLSALRKKPELCGSLAKKDYSTSVSKG